MAKVTYLDLERAAPYTKFHDIEFTVGQPVEVRNEEALEILRRHPYFKVEESKAYEKAHAPKPEGYIEPQSYTLGPEKKRRIFEAGAQAARAGADRVVPPRWAAWRSTWLEGYRSETRNGIQGLGLDDNSGADTPSGD